MSTNATVTESEAGSRFFPVALDSLDASTLEIDLYLKPKEDADPVLYRSSGVEFSAEDRKRLVRQHVKYIYIPAEQHAVYRKVLGDRLDKLYKDPTASNAERARVIRAACTKMIEDVLLFPGKTEMIDSVAEISKQFADWSEHDVATFSYFLDMSRHDYYTATHMLNVGVGCGLLARDLRPDDADFQAHVIQGGLLHDIGKRGVPEEILNKEGKLTPEEWEYVRTHPITGYNELIKVATVPDMVSAIARDHHERLDGKGYPNGIAGDDIGVHIRLASVVDAFDAICSTRPYRGPTPPKDTLKIMRDGAEGCFDIEILERWAALVEKMISEDPKRAVPSMGTPPSLTLDDLVQVVDSDADGAEVEEPRDERRRFPRCTYPANIKAMILHREQPGSVKIGDWINLKALDISQGGIKLVAPWPLSRKDVMALELPMKNGRRLRRQAILVYSRKYEEEPDHWLLGLQFYEG